MKFPKDFYFGATTSSHQVEGGNFNNWSKWEKQNAQKLAQNANENYKHLPNFKRIIKEAQKPQNYISAFASDQIHRYKEDVQIMRESNFNAYRFSIEWSRIEPKNGEFSRSGLAYYQNLINELKKNRIEPFTTLWHWTMPIWFDELGGFSKRANVIHFLRFVKYVVKNLKGVKYYIVLNEPEVITNKSYILGDWPPQKKSLVLGVRVLHNLIFAHNQSYKIIKEILPQSKVGIAKHNNYFESYKNRPINKLIAKILDYFANQYFIKKTIKYLDFIGLNYYFHRRIDIFGKQADNKKHSDMGWELYPWGLYHLLMDLKKYKKPLYITENGLADAHDTHRAWYIKEALKSVQKAIKDGADVRGYLYWSLLDNFEWAEGFWPRFGLVAVDYKTGKRTIRPSAKIYAKIIKESS